ncbi:MAG: DUF4381 domain-containing protein [Methylococcaceae bacterium]|nr:DUF4381 domain-containing protein [Methylococcaceae bacterium]
MQGNSLPLRDIHTSELIGWWPPAVGWWLLALAIPVLIFLVVWLYKRLTRKTAIKTAKKLLRELKQDTTADKGTQLQALSILIRRVAISMNARTDVASLTGRLWLNYLDTPFKGSPFSEGVGRYLADAPYRQSLPDDLDVSQLINLCEEWLKAQGKNR